jgi:hypothetical protein
MNRLSPLTRQALFSRLVFNRPGVDNNVEVEVRSTRNPHRRSAIEVTYWQCPECFDRFDDELEAEECCQGEERGPVCADGAETACPVCLETTFDHRNAADCCLWKDFDAPTRWRIADAVETGSDWITEIKKASEQ